MKTVEVERQLIMAVARGDDRALDKLRQYYADTDRLLVVARIDGMVQQYGADEQQLRDVVVRCVLSACPVCGGTDTEVRNFDELWRDGDIVCNECATYVRGFDAG